MQRVEWKAGDIVAGLEPKEEMVNWENQPLFKPRYTKTVGYELTFEELDLYNAVTRYVRARRRVAKARKQAQRDFRTRAKIMIATDAAGEGINLQFCRYLINWDIPWNPNRLEQRMGRIHRYGQRDDVWVYNLVAIYIWLKRGIGDVFPEIFATPLTPKSEEATALKHRHGGDGDKAEQHFTSKLAACFAEPKRMYNPHGLSAVMFAHQTTEAWTALINALFEAGLSITATYPIDTERASRMRGLDSSALASSITVICCPRQVGAAAFRDVRREIERVVAESVRRFWDYGFRGADLIVACYGPAVGVFGRYERVERADGTLVSVPELLNLVKTSALKAIAGEFTGDVLSRLYFVWANLYGIREQAWDDARLVVQIGGDSENAMDVARGRGLFVVDVAHCRLALLRDRANRRNLGEDATSPLIDQIHRAMHLWNEERRADPVTYLREHELLDHAPFWKLAQALFEVLPRGEEDWKLISALLSEREMLRHEARRTAPATEQTLFDI